ncbi:MAG: metalloregulator ArsR/SmtB family transcription factor [Pseudomonadota bacterium]
MPSRKLVARELAEVFKVLAHPDRIRVIEELRLDEQDVATLAARLELSASRVSQHLSLLRAHRMVDEERDGRRHLYHLVQPELAAWIIDALSFVEARGHSLSAASIDSVRRQWSGDTGSGS